MRGVLFAPAFSRRPWNTPVLRPIKRQLEWPLGDTKNGPLAEVSVSA